MTSLLPRRTSPGYYTSVATVTSCSKPWRSGRSTARTSPVISPALNPRLNLSRNHHPNLTVCRKRAQPLYLRRRPPRHKRPRRRRSQRLSPAAKPRPLWLKTTLPPGGEEPTRSPSRKPSSCAWTVAPASAWCRSWWPTARASTDWKRPCTAALCAGSASSTPPSSSTTVSSTGRRARRRVWSWKTKRPALRASTTVPRSRRQPSPRLPPPPPPPALSSPNPMPSCAPCAAAASETQRGCPPTVKRSTA